jgi:hypothetical protein
MATGSAVSRRALVQLAAASMLLASVSAGATDDGVVRSFVSSYELDGVKHYTNQAPPKGATNVRLILAFVQLPSGDVWRWVVNSEKEEIYLHPATLKLSEFKFGRAWLLASRLPTEPAGKAAASSKTFWEVDCNSSRYRTTTTIEYSKSFGRGEVVSSWSGDGAWTPVVPGTVGETIAGEICKPPPTLPSPPASG